MVKALQKDPPDQTTASSMNPQKVFYSQKEEGSAGIQEEDDER